MSEICRAITFINYHIPYRKTDDTEFQYTTLGFFDGMETKGITVDYEKKGLFTLWQHILDKTVKNNGQYSYQNVFCFSDDDWNYCTDQKFWSEETDRDYPLTFVSFLQLGDYSVGLESIQQRCILFRDLIKGKLNGEGKVYVYGTIDKNDFVVCMKCMDYKKAVGIIQNMHRERKVIYSYTVFSVLSSVLKKLSPNNYSGLFQQILPSICLKGVANSYDPLGQVTLGQRYRDFCMRLVSWIYDVPKNELSGKQKKKIVDPDANGKEIEVDYKIYDILGDNDFRLIVRNVNLGRLMQQFANDGMLSYTGRFFRFYLFSSSLMLNTETMENPDVEDVYLKRTLQCMETELRSPKCKLLEQTMEEIGNVIFTGGKYANEKLTTCWHAIWQLVQSMKALEAAPTKKYDFLSLYYPLYGLIDILKKKFSCMDDAQLWLLVENDEIFEFIHKISMTIHGTLRTDIQFFQIRDFNVILHYAPAKLRAFYTLWTLKIKDYYNMFVGKAENNQYSFIFSPGMFSGTSVQQLFEKYDETHRLMLITVPERHLYVPKWLTIMLAHETSHFVGWKIRNRKYREEMWLKCCAKAFSLEMRHYIFANCPQKCQEYVRAYFRENNRYETVATEHLERIREELVQKECLWPHQFHSENSFRTIQDTFRRFGEIYLGKVCAEEGERVAESIRHGLGLKGKPVGESIGEAKELWKFTIGMYRNMERFFDLFTGYFLMGFLRCCHYICAEVYADLNAILTLDLMPKDYLASFFSCELEQSYLESCSPDFNLLLPYRIALSIKTVVDVAGKTRYGGWLKENEPAFYDAWSKEVFDRLPQEFGRGSCEAKLAIKCRKIFLSLQNFSDNMDKYGSVFKADKLEFHWSGSNLLLEKGIWDCFLEYLEKCVKDYLDIAMGDKEIQQEKKRLKETYSKIAGASANQMMQEIEDFLSRLTFDDGNPSCKKE